MLLIVASAAKKIGGNPNRIPKIKPFISTYKWKGINYLPKKMIGENKKKIVIIAFNVLHVKEMNICPA